MLWYDFDINDHRWALFHSLAFYFTALIHFELRQLRPTVKSLPVDTAKTLIQAFISDRLDYCNAALCGITDTLLRQLQSVQNAAARLLTRTGRREHITPVLRQLHWLPVSRRIDFKLAVLMCQISHLTGTGYHVLTRQVQVGQ